MHGNSMHGNQETLVLPAALNKQRAGEGTQKDTPLTYGTGGSDHRVVPKKAPNKGETRGGAGGKAADQGERNEGTHEPGIEPGNRVKGTSRRAGSRTAGQRSTVHNTAASR
jgi:hypothetical protein